jgi:tetratricopeptide (TPR) repeat protein
LRHAATGAPRLVVIRGDAGMGKTTLVEAWESQVGDDVVVLRGRCDELGRDLPLQPIADALIDHLRDIGPGAAVDVLGGDAAVLAPILGPLAGDVEDAAATSVVDPEQGRARVFGALLAAVTRAAGSRRAVIVIEDLHDAGPSTVAWLAFAQRRAGRLMLVVTTRDARPVGLSPTRAVSVDALTRDDVAELVGPEHADEVFERTGGHPIFLGAAGEISGAQPVELRDVVTAQLATLDREAAGSTQLAAVAGSDCDVDLIASVRGVPSVDVVRHLESATRTGLVVERGAGFAFRHELIRDAVNATATGAQLVASHHAIAVALSRRPRVDPLAVAVHARDGGADDLATTSFIAAAEAASARFDVDAAEAHLASAIAATPSAPAPYVARARVRMSRSSFADAERDARTAVELGGGAAALEVAGWVAYYRRDYPHARAFAEEALAALPADSPLRVSASALAGRIRHGTGDLLGAVQLLEAPGQAPLAIRGIADVWLAQARLHQGRPLDALDALTRPSVAPDSLAHPWAPLHLRFNRIIALGQLGRGAEAMAVCDELDEVIRREGAVAARFVGPSNNAASWILRWTGRGDEADDRNRAALDASGGDDGPVAESHAEGYYVALLDLVDGRLLADDLAGAEPLIRRLAVVDGWNGTMAWHQRHRLDLQRSRIALADGDRDRATALASAVAVDAAARGARRYELLAIAHAALADDSIPDARLVPVVDGLGRCAQLDGWSLVDRIARQRSVDEWRRVAEDRATAVVAAAGGAADAARRLVERVLSR